MPGRHIAGGAAGSGGGGSYSESAALVRSTEGMSYTEEGRQQGGGGSPHDGGEDELMDSVDSEVSVLAQFHEDAIRQAGFGYSQWTLMFASGLGLAADTVELFVLPYILPSAEFELCINASQKTWLSGITFLGMMVGGVVWGNLSDRMGRRRTLMSALGVNAVFSVISAFMPTYGTFMTARFCSAVGVGGSLPIVFAYYSEFLCKADRSKYLSRLVVFWPLGGVLVALTAWAILPRTGIGVVIDNKEHFSAWHQLLLLCSLPSLVAIIGLVFLPESPRYLLEAGREVEAMMVYQRIYKTNNMHNPAAHAQYQLSELELPSKRPSGRGLSSPPPPGKSVLADMIYSIEMFWNSFLQLFVQPHLQVTLLFIVLWFTASFGYYGLTTWFPEYMQLLKTREYESRTSLISNATYDGSAFNTSVENIRWVDSFFKNCSFHHMTFSHVNFDNCTIEDVRFEIIKTSRTYFRNSIIKDSRFVDTDLTDQHFENCLITNVTVLSLSAGCPLDFDYNIYLEEVFHEHLVGQIAILPGALLSALAIGKLGRVKIIGLSMFLSSVHALCIWFLSSSTAMEIHEAVFNFIFMSGWNAMNIATIESYPTHLRTTGYGFVSATCRLGGMLGAITFSNLVTASRAAPMLTAAAVLLVGGIVSVKLPETNSVLL
ncbi:synaptic vesicle glycoprotein 2B-like [Zootermopsis nevadensis]|uniref:Synaptic vesicle glycoprotein 2B n=1 Tax=Zootermopsis nevadensis TaxID=136037 RepID=A0A067QMV0_ZOONE|nr:synaptic vesicle glycoprotein 2B-like [Zootermopsis nevadensis]KDR10619.1 Synaptic vesicle glycoprotein 2B [Zootermopsis nevadensis]